MADSSRSLRSSDLQGKMFWFCFCLGMMWCTAEGRRRISVRSCGTRDVVMARIIGGDEAQQGDYPWMVTVHENNQGFNHVCGGAILNEHWIVTAAHCIDFADKPWRYVIYTGLHKLSQKSHKRARKHRISKVVVHEDFDPNTFENDIALLRTKYSMDIKASKGFVNGVCLPNTAEDPTGWGIVTGWGHTVEEGTNSDTLKAVKVPIVPRHLCNKAYDEDPDDDEDEIFDTMICAGMVNRDSCQNDSGGPLLQKNRKGTHTLIGIVSYGSGCGGKSHPGVYTKVAAYLDWMEQNMDL